MFIFLILFVVQFNNCIGFRPELQGIPLTSGEPCQARVRYISIFTRTNACKLLFEEDECRPKSPSYIKDCSECDCLNGRNINYYQPNISVMVPKINPQIVERIEKSNAFEVAGFVVPDTLYHVAISVIGIIVPDILSFFPRDFMDFLISKKHMSLRDVPRWLRQAEILDIQEKVYTFELEDLLFV